MRVRRATVVHAAMHKEIACTRHVFLCFCLCFSKTCDLRAIMSATLFRTIGQSAGELVFRTGALIWTLGEKVSEKSDGRDWPPLHFTLAPANKSGRTSRRPPRQASKLGLPIWLCSAHYPLHNFCCCCGCFFLVRLLQPADKSSFRSCFYSSMNLGVLCSVQRHWSVYFPPRNRQAIVFRRHQPAPSTSNSAWRCGVTRNR